MLRHWGSYYSDAKIASLVPVVDGGGTFTQKPGSAVTVKTDDQAYECYFHGSSFALPWLKALGLSFIRAAEEP